MTTSHFARCATALACACAAWISLLVMAADAYSSSQAAIISLLTLIAVSASMWFVGIVTDRGDGDVLRLGGSRTLDAQVAVTRALREVPGAASKGELFALLAERERPLTLVQLERTLADLERAGVVLSDYDEACGERAWRLATLRRRVGAASVT